MNTTQLRKLGVPDACLTSAIQGIQSASQSGDFKGSEVKQLIKSVLDTPADHTTHPHFGGLAQALIAEEEFIPHEPAKYQTWGTDIDEAAHAQMRQSCDVPVSRRGALMPDAHVGYGLPIGGVLACENAVIPYAVGVDIACRMKLSVLDLPPSASGRQVRPLQDGAGRGHAVRRRRRARDAARAPGDGPGLDGHAASPANTRTRPGSNSARRVGKPLRRVRRADARPSRRRTRAGRRASTSRC